MSRNSKGKAEVVRFDGTGLGREKCNKKSSPSASQMVIFTSRQNLVGSNGQLNSLTFLCVCVCACLLAFEVVFAG